MRNVNIGNKVVKFEVTAGFILTMRNVNVEKVQGVNRKVKGFILTMRNVNKNEKIIKNMIRNVLY